MAVVIANYIRPGRQARAKAKATLLYNAERLGREKQEITRILFGWQGPMERGEAELLIDRAPKGTVFFRVMINFDPVKEDPDKLLNIWEIVRKTYETLERALGLEGKIQFIAALHDDHTSPSPHPLPHAGAPPADKRTVPRNRLCSPGCGFIPGPCPAANA